MGVAIHGELGNPPITDATAVTEDVTEGKVFYNNDGRCIGTAINLLPGVKSMHYFIPKNKTFNWDKSLSNSFNAVGLSLPNMTPLTSYVNRDKYSERFALNGMVVGFAVNGSEPYIVNSISHKAFIIGEELQYMEHDELYFFFTQNDGYIYIYGDAAKATWTYAPITTKRDLDIIIYYK